MGGWERTGTEDCPVWVLEFPHRPGLEVRCTLPSLRGRVLAARLAPTLAVGADRTGRALLALAEVFAEDSLLGWNLLWNGRPREASAAGIGRVDLPLIAEILTTWIGLWAEQPAAAGPEEDWSQLDALSRDLDGQALVDEEPALDAAAVPALAVIASA